MPTLNDMTPEQRAALKPGDSVEIRTERANDFRAYFIDASTVLGNGPVSITLSLARTEARDITTHGVLRDVDGGGAHLDIGGVTARPVSVEDLQVTMRLETARDLAVAVLTNLSLADPTFVQAGVLGSKQLAELFKAA